MRWYRKKNLEPLAIVRKKGNPHLFITMTCNPNHPQILRALPHGFMPGDCPDIVLRVFYRQVHQLLYVLYEKKIPGREGIKGIIKVIAKLISMQKQRYRTKKLTKRIGKM